MPRRSRASSSGESTPSLSTEISSEALSVISSTASSMSEKAVRKMVEQMALPLDFGYLVPEPSHRVNAPPPGCLTVYASQVTSGLFFPLLPVVSQFFAVLGIPPSQLLPNSYRLLVGFLLCFQLYTFEASLENLLGVFMPKLTTGECFFYLSPRPGLTFIRDKPSSHGSWKSRFFFVRKDNWEVPLAWSILMNPLPFLNLTDVKERMLSVGLTNHGFNAKSILERELLVVSGLLQVSDLYEGPESRYARFRMMMNRAAVRKFIPDDVPAIPSSSGTRSASETPSDVPSSSIPPTTPTAPLPLGAASLPQGLPVIEVDTSPEAEAVPFQTSLEDPPLSPISPPVEVTSSSQKRPCIEDPTGDDSPKVFPVRVLTPRLDPKTGVFNMVKATNRKDVEELLPRPMLGLGHFLLTQTSTIPAIVTAMMEKYEALERNFEGLRQELKTANTRLEERLIRRDEEGVASGFAMYRNTQEFNDEVCRRGSSFYIDGFAVCLEQFKNLGNLPPGFDFSFLNVRADAFGRMGDEGPSGG
ncbi:UNVERIFIED_CONTAM: hypothetical protein Slati_1438100 [Sesamum latifolium]|uniref:Uncharacterized protein n=1 Tax=Sesamum latifolium TaxID=2727402 RepID=A0AAW2X7S2_9LAMI